MTLTNFPNGITSFGIPQLGDGIPSTFGTYIFVDPDATGANNGKTMKNAFTTVGQAASAATTNKHDVILMNANSAHSTGSGTEEELTLTKSRVHFVGLGGGSRYLGQRTRWTLGDSTTDDSDAIAVIQNTGVGNTFTNIKFDSGDVNTTSLYAVAEGGEYTQYTNCEIVKSSLLSTASRANVLLNGDTAYFHKCAIGSLVYEIAVSTGTNVLLARTTIAGKVARDCIFDDCLFLLKTSDSAASQFHATGATDVERMLIIRNSMFINAVLSSATPGEAILVDSAQTQGHILVHDSHQYNHTALASTATNVFFTGPEIVTAATAGDAREAAD